MMYLQQIIINVYTSKKNIIRNLIFLIVLTYMIPSSAESQQILSTKTVDSISYSYYMNKDWTKLIDFAENSIDNGFEFAMLRMRLGIAYFEKSNYIDAIKNFEKVLEFDSSNKTAMEYLYYCNKYLNRDGEADYTAYKFPESVRKKINYRSIRLAERVNLEGGVKFNNNKDRDNLMYYYIGLDNTLLPVLKLSLYFQQYQQKKYYDFFNFVQNKKDRYSFTVNQYQYFIKPSLHLPLNITVIPAFNYVSTKWNNTYTYSRGYHLSVIKSVSKFDVGGYFNYSDLNNSYQRQWGLYFNTYPLGNLNLYTLSTLTLQNQNKTNYIIFDQVLGGKVSDFLWLEASATFGDIDNYTEKQGLYIYNSIDKTTFKFGSSAIFYISSEFQFEIQYQLENKKQFGTNKEYKQNAIIGGIKWTF